MVSTLPVVSGVLLVPALVMVWVSCLRTAWLSMESDPQYLLLGLWRACTYGDCVSVFSNDKVIIHSLGDWYQAAQAFAVIGLILFNIAACLCFFYIIEIKPTFINGIIPTLSLGTVSYGIATTTFALGANHKDLLGQDRMKFDYCFYVACLSVVTCLIDTILWGIEYWKRRSSAGYISIN